MIRGLLVIGLVLGGCDWREFDELGEQAWVEVADARDDASAVVAPYTNPSTSGFSGPSFLRFAPSASTLQSFIIDLNGSIRRREERLSDLGLATASEFLTAARPEEGLVVIAGRVATGYQVATGRAGTIQAPATTIAADEIWRGLAVSDERLFAISTDDELVVIDRSTLEPVTSDGAPAGRCPIDTSEIQGAPSPTQRIAAIAAGYAVVSSDGSLLEVGLPLADDDGNPDAADPCLSAPLSADLVDGPLIAGEFVTSPDPQLEGVDLLAVTIGSQLAVLSNWIGPGTVTPELIIEAPADASSQWGQSATVGDIDGDGDFDIAVGDPGREAVDLYDLGAADRGQRVATLEPQRKTRGFGRSVTAVAFASGDKDLLVVGSDTKVFTYFRVFAVGDADPRR